MDPLLHNATANLIIGQRRPECWVNGQIEAQSAVGIAGIAADHNNGPVEGFIAVKLGQYEPIFALCELIHSSLVREPHKPLPDLISLTPDEAAELKRNRHVGQGIVGPNL